MDLLRGSGHEDKYFESLIRFLTGVPNQPDLKNIPHSPLNIAMMGKAGLDWPKGEKPSIAAAQSVYNVTLNADRRLEALFEASSALSDRQILEIIEGFQSDTDNPDNGLAGGIPGQSLVFDLETALSNKGAQGFYELYQISTSGPSEARTPALLALLERTDRKGAFLRFAQLMKPQIKAVDFSLVRYESLPLLIKAAIHQNDLGALQQIYMSLEGNSEAQERVALASDAIGNGFYGGNLGTDIDSRLSRPATKNRAIRDALLAYALGANLSDTAETVLVEKANLGRYSGELFALDDAARRRAQAETALRSANILESSGKDKTPDFVIYKIVEALYQSGLTTQAAQIAAMDFIQDFPE